MAVADIKVKKWNRAEWRRLIDLGVLTEDDPFELLDGEIVEMTPQSHPHAGTVWAASEVLREAFGKGFVVGTGMPVALDDWSEPEPDITVARGSSRDFFEEHPTEPVLIVEVAMSSLSKDRIRKSSLYARAGRPEYWIVNLHDLVLEVYRDPVQDGRGYYGGWSYPTILRLAKADTVAPLAAPGRQIAVADLLP